MEQPDEFITFSSKAFNWLQEHLKQVITAIVCILVIVVIISSIHFWKRSHHIDASKLLLEAAEMSTWTVVEKEKKNDTTENNKVDTQKQFKDEQERYGKIVDKLKEIQQKHSSSKVEYLSRIFASDLALEEDDQEAVLEDYKYLEKKLADDRYIYPLILENLGYYYENKKEYAKALQYYQKISDNEGFYNDYGLFHQIRISKIQGKKDSVQELIKQFLEKFPTSKLKARVKEIQNRLGV